MIELITGIFRVIGEITLWFFGSVIKVIKLVLQAFAEVIDELFNTKPKKSSAPPIKPRVSVAPRPERPVIQKVAPRPERPAIQKVAPEAAFPIDPVEFSKWAGEHLPRWELLHGAMVSHKLYGEGFIERVYRAGERFDQIVISMCMEKNGQSAVFYAGDFATSKKAFYDLRVDSRCNFEFQKGTETLRNVEAFEAAEQIRAAKTNNWKPDWKDIAGILKLHQIKHLYHFTDTANFSSIIEHGGLYSWWSSQEKGIKIPRPGGNDTSRTLDSRRKLQDYVRLSFNDNHPMLKQALHEGRINNPFVLKIHPEVIYWKATLFSNMNAAANDAKIGATLADLKQVRFDIVTQEIYDEHSKSLYQAEVLVKSHIPLKYILNIP